VYVIGTAGHVDHGKSALVQALTGIDPDRLREEKERGLTIDLGFAWLRLPSGEEAGIVDVPGHERFIKNMLAGVGGIDLALLVIAADEGVMPQTREHLAIIDLLGIDHGVVALTKADLVEREFLELALADAAEVLSGTTLQESPIVPCSAVTREGLEQLVAALESQLAQTPGRRDIGRPRLPIDRVFTMTGFGTVVTGTLIDGQLRAGQEIEILPGGLRSRIRGLQSHGRKVETASPGRRTAVNLAGLAVDDLRRGMVLANPGTITAATMLDVHLRAVRDLQRPVRHNTQITFHTGAAEGEARLALLDRNELAPSESGWAQVRLAEPVAVLKGDRFVIRDPNDTLGGGRVIDAQVRRHRRFHSPTLAALQSLAEGSPEEIVRMAAERLGPAEPEQVVRESGLDAQSAREALEGLLASGDLVSLPSAGLTGVPLVVISDTIDRLRSNLIETLSEYHRRFPLRAGMPREALRARLGLSPRGFEQVETLWEGEGRVVERTGAIALPDHEPSPDEEQLQRCQTFLAALESDPFAPAPKRVLDEELLSYLESQGRVVRASDGVTFSAAAYKEMVERITAHIGEHGSVTLAQVRDIFGTSRKYAQALLEHLDSERITRRVGDERVLRERPRTASS